MSTARPYCLWFKPALRSESLVAGRERYATFDNAVKARKREYPDGRSPVLGYSVRAGHERTGPIEEAP